MKISSKREDNDIFDSHKIMHINLQQLSLQEAITAVLHRASAQTEGILRFYPE